MRAIDPDSQSGAGDTHGIYSAIMSWKDIYVGLTPVWLMNGIGQTFGVGLAMMIGFAVAGFAFFNRRKGR